MLLNSIILGALVVFVLVGFWLIVRAPQCRTCKARMQTVGEQVRPWGRFGMDAMFYYVCPECDRMTQRRHMILHLD
jgi:hypothetical protein